MEIDVTRLAGDIDPAELSGSVAERGENAGSETWSNSVAAATASAVLQPDQRQKARDYFGTFGAWDDEERAGWSDEELDALVLQYAAGDLRELQSLAPGDGIADIDWQEAERLSERGTVAGNLFASGGKLYIYLGN